MEALYQFLNQIGYTHPLHPPMTYIPLGMVIGSLVFSLLSFLPRFGKYSATARHCITLAFIGVFPTILFGYLDWQYFYGGNLIFPIKMKMVLAAVLVFLLALALILYRKFPVEDKRIFGVHVLCFFTIVGIGYFGGELVFGEKTAPAIQAGTDDKVAYPDVRPIFDQNCSMCHTGSNAPKGLLMDSYDGIMAGSNAGPVVVPEKPQESELVKRIRGTSEPRMPFRRPPLAEDEIQRIEKWIRQGAREQYQ
jgi:hypothetical protein